MDEIMTSLSNQVNNSKLFYSEAHLISFFLWGQSYLFIFTVAVKNKFIWYLNEGNEAFCSFLKQWHRHIWWKNPEKRARQESRQPSLEHCLRAWQIICQTMFVHKRKATVWAINEDVNTLILYRGEKWPSDSQGPPNCPEIPLQSSSSSSEANTDFYKESFNLVAKLQRVFCNGHIPS